MILLITTQAGIFFFTFFFNFCLLAAARPSGIRAGRPHSGRRARRCGSRSRRARLCYTRRGRDAARRVPKASQGKRKLGVIHYRNLVCDHSWPRSAFSADQPPFAGNGRTHYWALNFFAPKLASCHRCEKFKLCARGTGCWTKGGVLRSHPVPHPVPLAGGAPTSQPTAAMAASETRRSNDSGGTQYTSSGRSRCRAKLARRVCHAPCLKRPLVVARR